MELVNVTSKCPNSQLDPPLAASLCRLVVIHAMISYVIRHGRKSFASHSWNFSRMQTSSCWVTQITRGGRSQVVGWLPIGRKASQVRRRSVASVWRRSGRGCFWGSSLCRKAYEWRMRVAISQVCHGAVASHLYYLVNYTLFVFSYVSRSPTSM